MFVCLCLPRLQHGALGFSQSSSSSSPSSRTTAPTPYFRGNDTPANTTIPVSLLYFSAALVLRSPDQSNAPFLVKKKTKKTPEVSVRFAQCWVTKSLKDEPHSYHPAVGAAGRFYSPHICPFLHFLSVLDPVTGTLWFYGFSRSSHASCGDCLSFSYGGTSKSLNSSKSLCGGWPTQKKWESLNFKWVMACLSFFYTLEGVDGLLREEGMPMFFLFFFFIWTQGARLHGNR